MDKRNSDVGPSFSESYEQRNVAFIAFYSCFYNSNCWEHVTGHGMGTCLMPPTPSDFSPSFLNGLFVFSTPLDKKQGLFSAYTAKKTQSSIIFLQAPFPWTILILQFRWIQEIDRSEDGGFCSWGFIHLFPCAVNFQMRKRSPSEAAWSYSKL